MKNLVVTSLYEESYPPSSQFESSFIDDRGKCCRALCTGTQKKEGRNARNRKKESYRGIEEISPRKPSFLFLLPQSRRWRIGAKVDRTRARFASLYRARLPGQFASSTVYSSCGFIGTTFNQWSYPPSSIPFVIDIENAAMGTEKIIPSDNPRFY